MFVSTAINATLAASRPSFHPLVQRVPVGDVHGKWAWALHRDHPEAVLLLRLGFGDGGTQCLFDDVRERHPSFGRELLRRTEDLVVEVESGFHDQITISIGPDFCQRPSDPAIRATR